MQYEFLKQFTKRMKHVGMYALLLQNSMAKQIWKQYGFMKVDEQINLIFAVMLYIMEQSLREVRWTTLARILTPSMPVFSRKACPMTTARNWGILS